MYGVKIKMNKNEEASYLQQVSITDDLDQLKTELFFKIQTTDSSTARV